MSTEKKSYWEGQKLSGVFSIDFEQVYDFVVWNV